VVSVPVPIDVKVNLRLTATGTECLAVHGVLTGDGPRALTLRPVA
jgi:hypothetical protein